MKKTFSIILCIFLLFALGACAENGEAVPSGSTVPAETYPPTESVTETSQASTFPQTTQSVTVTTSETTAQTTASTTSAVTTETVTVSETTTEAGDYVTLSIDCKTILENKNKLSAGKAEFVPDDGVILETKVGVSGGETAFDVLKAACASNPCAANCKYCKKGIQLEYTFTPAYKTYYVEGIHQLYQFDCGASSGWMYSVNGVFPEVGCSSYEVKSGDDIRFSYTCDSGFDLNSPDT